MKLVAVDSRHNIGSWMIKIFTFSRWNHVAALFEDHEDVNLCSVVDVTFTSGVRIMSYARFRQEYPRHELIHVEVPDEKSGYDWAISQIGKGYDFTALIGIVFQNRKWEDPLKWFCSELFETICVHAGRRRIRSNISGVLPRESYAVI